MKITWILKLKPKLSFYSNITKMPLPTFKSSLHSATATNPTTYLFPGTEGPGYKIWIPLFTLHSSKDTSWTGTLQFHRDIGALPWSFL